MAVDQSAFQTQGRAAAAPSTFIVKQNGQLAEVSIPREQFQAVSNGFHRLKFKAMTQPFELDGQFGRSKNVRVVFQVRGGPEDKRMFSQLLSIAKPGENGSWKSNVSAKSAPGQMIGAIRGRAIGDGEPINFLEFLNGEFMAMVKQETKAGENGLETRCSVVKDTWAPAGQTALPPELQPVPQAAAAPANPFLDSDD